MRNEKEERSYCCKDMKDAMETIRDIHSVYHSIFRIRDAVIKFDTHINGEYGYIRHHEMILRYCPFCGKELLVIK